MPMNPRLMRPRQTGLHPEAQVWRNAVIANGGTVSGSTLAAVSKFCFSIDAANIRDRFYRLNLFCGNNLLACLVPLYRGQSRTSTQYGNTTDTNNGPFISGDYTETTASGGLWYGGVGTNTSKRLDTGFPANTLTVGDRHLAAYEIVNATTDYSGSLQYFSSAIGRHWRLGTWTNVNNYIYSAFANVGGQPVFTKATGFIVGQNDSDTAGTIYRNGVSVSSVTGGIANAVDSSTVQVLGHSSGEFSEARLGGYSIGQRFTSTQQVAAYYSAMQAFQTALGRNV